ncbi:MAG TPA: hypothetical protein VF384_02260 [Planctomycetota bacterium]
MHTRSHAVLALVLLATGACQRATEASATAREVDPLAALQLDAGKRWISDDHTRTSLAGMRAAVQAAAGDPSRERTIALGKQLQDLGDRLVAGCTMTGPAHDALHHYLGVLLPDIHRMTGSDFEAARQARREVAAILDRFGDYFQ